MFENVKLCCVFCMRFKWEDTEIKQNKASKHKRNVKQRMKVFFPFPHRLVRVLSRHFRKDSSLCKSNRQSDGLRLRSAWGSTLSRHCCVPSCWFRSVHCCWELCLCESTRRLVQDLRWLCMLILRRSRLFGQLWDFQLSVEVQSSLREKRHDWQTRRYHL